MSQKYEKLKTLLQELFQLDQPDLAFGLYRVMHAKSAEITQFLDNDLLPQVKDAFALYRSADKADMTMLHILFQDEDRNTYIQVLLSMALATKQAK